MEGWWGAVWTQPTSVPTGPSGGGALNACSNLLCPSGCQSGVEEEGQRAEGWARGQPFPDQGRLKVLTVLVPVIASFGTKIPGYRRYGRREWGGLLAQRNLKGFSGGGGPGSRWGWRKERGPQD